VITGIGAFFIL